VSGVVFVAIVAVGSSCANTTNPPVVREPKWDAPTTRALAVRACFDCHSNATNWPWYASVPFVGWWLQDHVEEGREHLNFSTWDAPGHEADEAAEVVDEGEMPLSSYVALHGEAALNDAEKKALVAGLQATFRADPPARRAEKPGDAEHREGDHADH
jgi:hypothetical protein